MSVASPRYHRPGRRGRELARALRFACALALTNAVTLTVGGLTVASAADTPITWGFSPTPTVVSIQVNDTVTWNGNLVFHPVRITDASFTATGATVSSGGGSYTRSFPLPGTYYFMCAAHGSSMPTTVNVSCPPPPATLAVLDIDGNGQVDATTDGLLTLRYLLGLRGNALTTGALGACASRDVVGIESYLAARVVP